MKRTELRLPDFVYEQLRQIAFDDRTSLNQTIVDIILIGLITMATDDARIANKERKASKKTPPEDSK